MNPIPTSSKNNPTRVVTKANSSVRVYDVMSRRSVGYGREKLGFGNEIALKLYSSFDTVNDASVMPAKCSKNWGGIFNLEYSRDGRIVLAACEGKQILIFDAANQKQINVVEDAHSSCVNCVRFLSHNTFATCSDDTLVKVWDIRKLKKETSELHGHSNWVKNIEWSEKENVMVTSAFDGTILARKIDSIGEMYGQIFLMQGLMRMKITPDGNKMIVSTTSGYMMIIHDLDLMMLKRDLKNFRPDVYRLMQTSDQSFPVATSYNHLFNPNRKRNRIELIDDFPNDAQVISSLQIHPHGWSAVSRNLNGDKNEEWTSVHDIQDRDLEDYESCFTYDEEDEPQESDTEEPPRDRPTDLWMSYIYLEDYNENRMRRVMMPSTGILNSGLIAPSRELNAYFEKHPEDKNKIIKNLPRMTHYLKETNSGSGFIKELCFSSDGRIICSPFDKGIRLLSFNERCQEMSVCVPERPQQLKTVVEMNDYHKNTVVSCKFSPTMYQLVTGCLSSEIKWYQPIL